MDVYFDVKLWIDCSVMKIFNYKSEWSLITCSLFADEFCHKMPWRRTNGTLTAEFSPWITHACPNRSQEYYASYDFLTAKPRIGHVLKGAEDEQRQKTKWNKNELTIFDAARSGKKKLLNKSITALKKSANETKQRNNEILVATGALYSASKNW